MYSLEGLDGNAFNLVAYVARAMRNEDKSQDEIEAFKEKAQSDDYNHLLQECMKMVDELNGVEPEEVVDNNNLY